MILPPSQERFQSSSSGNWNLNHPQEIRACAVCMCVHACAAAAGLPEILPTVTFQLLWPLATTNCGSLWPRIASLWLLKCCGHLLQWTVTAEGCKWPHCEIKLATKWPIRQLWAAVDSFIQIEFRGDLIWRACHNVIIEGGEPPPFQNFIFS